MPGSKGFVSSVLGILFIVAIVAWVVQDPPNAAQFFNTAIALIQRILEGLMEFFTEIAKQFGHGKTSN